MHADVGRYREIWGDMGRYGEMWGDVGRQGDVGRASPSAPPGQVGLRVGLLLDIVGGLHMLALTQVRARGRVRVRGRVSVRVRGRAANARPHAGERRGHDRDGISLHLPASPHISLHLPTSPCTSPYLPASPHISLHLPTSAHIPLHPPAPPCISQVSDVGMRETVQYMAAYALTYLVLMALAIERFKVALLVAYLLWLFSAVAAVGLHTLYGEP